jgi:hypothetical protein
MPVTPDGGAMEPGRRHGAFGIIKTATKRRRSPTRPQTDLGRPEDDLAVSGSGGRGARPGGRHCEQRLGKGPARPPGPATSQNAR